MAYASISHLNRYFEHFATHYYGTYLSDSGTLSIATTDLTGDLGASFDKINIMLDAIGRIPIVPIGTNTKTGSYNSFLIEWNCSDLIYTKLCARHLVEFNGRLPDWMLYFGSRCRDIYGGILAGHYPLDLDTTNRGIGYPIPITKAGFATFHTNWDSGFYERSDFARIYHIKITGTGSGNEIGQAYFKSSEDGGYSWLTDESVTATTWVGFGYGITFRWEPGTLTGTRKQLEIDDEWKFTCIPASIRAVEAGASFKTFGRG